jgi:poly-gamma-glutamate synthesis protein (capsule biosynthesis protein)
MSEPEILDDLKAFGFNVFNTANNHSLDYGEGGLLATIRHLRERGMAFCGTGKDLEEASAPVYLTEGGVTAAFIGLSASYNAFNPAGSANRAVPGRPGLKPLGHTETYHVTPEHYAVLEEIARNTAMNAQKDYSRKNGYSPALKEGILPFGTLTFRRDDRDFKETRPLEKDMRRTAASIREAKEKADLVFVSIHLHTFDGTDPSEPARYMEEAARRMIDAGADGIIGHGPHELRGIEIYRGKPIFYSLGNFIFQTETVRVQPAEAFTNKGLDPDASVRELMLERSHGDTTGYCALQNIWRSVIAVFDMEDGNLTEIRLYPVSLGMGKPWEERGWPHLSGDEDCLRYLAKLSAPYGTQIRVEKGVGTIRP